MDITNYWTPDLSKVAELDNIIDILQSASDSLVHLYENINDFNRNEAAGTIARNAGVTEGLVMRLKQLKG